MDDPDQLLLNSLKTQGVQIREGVGMGQLTTEDLISIALQFLSIVGVPQFEISSIKTTKSAFRQGGRIQEMLLDRGLRVDIQSIINPNINDSRRLVVNFMSKISQGAKQGGETRQLTFEERVQEEISANKQNSMKQFFQEWVNPTLLHHAHIEQRFLRLHVLNILKQEPIVRQLGNKGVRRHLYWAMASTMEQESRNHKKQKDDPQQEQRLLLVKKMRRQADPDAFLAEYIGKLETEPEAPEWEDLLKGNRQMKKAIRLMKEDDKEEEEARKVKEQENQGLFNLEIQYQEEVQQQQQLNEQQEEVNKQIEDLNEALKQQRELFDKVERRRNQLEEKNHKKQEDLFELQEQNGVNQKTIESAHLVLQQLDQKSVSDQDLIVLGKEIEDIRVEWEKQRFELRSEIDDIMSKAQERRLKVDQYQDKLRRLQEENQMIRNEGRVNLDKKEQLIVEFQNMPKDASRKVYIKKISDLRTNWERQQKEYEKVSKELQQLNDSIEFQNKTLERYYVELENLMNTDPKKVEQIAKHIQKQYMEYRNLHKCSTEAIKELGNKKIQVYEMEIKSETLITKGYKVNVDKLKHDLNEVVQDNMRLQNSQQ